MKKKMTYVAPETEQMVIRMEANFLTSGNFTVGAFTTDNNGTWDDDE